MSTTGKCMMLFINERAKKKPPVKERRLFNDKIIRVIITDLSKWLLLLGYKYPF